MADWAELTTDILGILVERLELMEDYHRFRAVCKPWRSFTPVEKKPKFSLKFPSLMLDETNYDGKQDQGRSLETRRKFYSQLTSQIYEINLPEFARKNCMGVYPGWILTLGLDDLQIDVFNPFTRQKFSLPSMLHFKDQYRYSEDLRPEEVTDVFVMKVVASSSPEQDDCIFLAIYGEFQVLAFARLGDEVWTNINVFVKVFDDAIYYRGNFYAVDRGGVVYICDLHHEDGPTTIIVAQPPVDPRFDELWLKYLVESHGEIYLVLRQRGGMLYDAEECSEEEKVMRQYYTVWFNVFRLVREDDSSGSSIYPYYRLEDVDDLGDMAFFLGYNVSTSISASPGYVRANCIYFCDDHHELWLNQLGGGGHDTGIFDMQTGDIDWHEVSHQFKFRSHINPPFWII